VTPNRVRHNQAISGIAIPNAATPNFATFNHVSHNHAIPDIATAHAATPNLAISNLAIPNLTTPHLKISKLGIPNPALSNIATPVPAIPLPSSTSQSIPATPNSATRDPATLRHPATTFVKSLIHGLKQSRRSEQSRGVGVSDRKRQHEPELDENQASKRAKFAPPLKNAKATLSKIVVLRVDASRLAATIHNLNRTGQPLADLSRPPPLADLTSGLRPAEIDESLTQVTGCKGLFLTSEYKFDPDCSRFRGLFVSRARGRIVLVEKIMHSFTPFYVCIPFDTIQSWKFKIIPQKDGEPFHTIGVKLREAPKFFQQATDFSSKAAFVSTDDFSPEMFLSAKVHQFLGWQGFEGEFQTAIPELVGLRSSLGKRPEIVANEPFFCRIKPCTSSFEVTIYRPRHIALLTDSR
jgi:hypothetical protein